jgi:hypothetical protein
MTEDNVNNNDLNEEILGVEETEQEDYNPLEGILSSFELEDDDEAGDVTLSANLISTVKVYSDSLPEGITVAEAYNMYAEKLGIDTSRIVGYKANNEVVLGNTKVEPNTSYQVVIQNQHKG